VEGKGNRGRQFADESSGAFQNSYVMAACEEAMALRIVESVRPMLDRFGGICLMVDAVYVRHKER
jgi:hypothetical protein